jgi:hypothetical protein
VADADTFDLHEDEWGMVDLVPAENHAHASTVVDEARRHGEAHRDGIGWNAVYVAPAPAVPLTVRGWTVDALAAELPGWTRATRVTSGYASLREEVLGAFAFRHGGSAVYGAVEGGTIRALHLDVRGDTPGLRDVLVRLGRAARLILVDLWTDRVVDLADPAAVEAWIAG